MIRKHPLLSFVLLVALTPYAVLVPLLAAGADPQSLAPLKLMFACTPLFYAGLVAWSANGEEGLSGLFGKLWSRQTRVAWYLIAATIFVAVGFGACGLRFAVDGFFPPRSEFASLGTLAAMSLPLLLFPGFTEEFAWRGLLQSGLQRRCNWWTASLLVGVVWGTWHGFDFLLGNWTFAWPTFGFYPLFILSNSIIIGWVYEKSAENVFVAMLAHFSSNCVSSFMPIFEDSQGSLLPAVLYVGSLCVVALLLPLVDVALARRRSVAS